MGWRMRHPKTAQEIRRASADMAEGIKVRAARNPIHIPTAWDDQWRSDQRCWKVQRRLPYRNVAFA